jgi:hypothetical protein
MLQPLILLDIIRWGESPVLVAGIIRDSAQAPWPQHRADRGRTPSAGAKVLRLIVMDRAGFWPTGNTSGAFW